MSALLAAGDPLLNGTIDWVDVLLVVIKTLVTFGVLLVSVLFMVWFERKIISDMQNRIGPNRAGPWGILQALADGIKSFFKEDLLPERADRLIFDLDPGEGLAFSDVAAAAREVRAFLDGLGLTSFLKTTGGKGLHLVCPIEREHDWRDVKAFARHAGEAIAAAAPDRYLTRISKAERRGKIFIDYLRNDPTSTAVAPYSTRSREGAPVATPIAWDELVPVGRMAETWQIKPLALLLASDAGSYMTGAHVMIDGGMQLGPVKPLVW